MRHTRGRAQRFVCGGEGNWGNRLDGQLGPYLCFSEGGSRRSRSTSERRGGHSKRERVKKGESTRAEGGRGGNSRKIFPTVVFTNGARGKTGFANDTESHTQGKRTRENWGENKLPVGAAQNACKMLNYTMERERKKTKGGGNAPSAW